MRDWNLQVFSFMTPILFFFYRGVGGVKINRMASEYLVIESTLNPTSTLVSVIEKPAVAVVAWLRDIYATHGCTLVSKPNPTRG